MDLWSVQLKYRNPSHFLPSNPIPCLEKSAFAANKIDYGARPFEIRLGKRNPPSSALNFLVVKVMAKKNPGNSSSSSSGNDDQSIPEGDGRTGKNLPGGNSANPKPHHKTVDWREFRATLFAREQTETADTGNDHGKPQSKPLGLKWAHPISLPEAGSVLVATEKLDGVRTFERTVVLLLRSGTSHPQEGPFGVIINRSLNKKIKHMKPNNPDLVSTLSDCSLHFGGPLEASMFLVKTGDKTKLPGIEEVIPGLGYGTRNSLDEAIKLVNKGVLKPQDFRFFVGYSGWQLDQLRDEIDSDYWHVAACSSNLIFSGANSLTDNLWEEILQLMGGQYSELSRKPKQDF
ncbi:hypothetical protein V2J09_017401 [Rumex salicifolius]